MPRWTAALTFVILGSVILAGCGGGGPSAAQTRTVNFCKAYYSVKKTSLKQELTDLATIGKSAPAGIKGDLLSYVAQTQKVLLSGKFASPSERASLVKLANKVFARIITTCAHA